jgi:hypothetical protein
MLAFQIAEQARAPPPRRSGCELAQVLISLEVSQSLL